MSEYLTRHKLGDAIEGVYGDILTAFECIDDADRYPVLTIECRADGKLDSMEKPVCAEWFARWLKKHSILIDSDDIPQFVRGWIPETIAEATREALETARHERSWQKSGKRRAA